MHTDSVSAARVAGPAADFARGGQLARPASLRLRRGIAQIVMHEDGAAIGGLAVCWGGGSYLSAPLEGATRPVRDVVTPPGSRRETRRHTRAETVVVATGQSVPLVEGAAGVALDVFGPQDTVEVQRLLAPNGLFLVVVPTVAHLAELLRPLAVLRVTRRRPSRPVAAVGRFRRGITRVVSYQVDLDRADVADLVDVDVEDLRSVPEQTTVTISARISSYRAR
ncbi:MAG: hypothetical protein H0T85_01995 [Geodermatophilaceae bacterium]|nr:hypothetical protein [Geodermatophilaceae bacterium]